MRERDVTEQVQAMSDEELEATRRDLITSIGFMTPVNGMYAPANTLLSAVSAELAQRQVTGHQGSFRWLESRPPATAGHPGA